MKNSLINCLTLVPNRIKITEYLHTVNQKIILSMYQPVIRSELLADSAYLN